MAGKYEAKDFPLQAVLFSSNTKYRIPRYQRPYSWEEDQISDLWDDLSSDDDSFLIGSLIFNREHVASEGFVDIIDGQQRLLTVTILCAVLRDLSQKLSFEDLSSLIHDQDIAIRDRSGNYTYRIRIGDSAASFFENNVQDNKNNIFEIIPTNDEEKRLKNCYLFFKRKIEEMLGSKTSNESKKKYIEEIREKYSNIQTIQINISSEEDAYEIFEATNARGLELSVADLLKNLIFQKIRKKDDKDHAKDVWQEIVNNVAATDTELRKFLRYYYISKHSFVPERKLFKEFKKEISDWDATLMNLWNASQLYKNLLEGTEEDFKEYGKDNAKIFRSIFSLRLMGVSQCYVLLLSILRNFDNLHTTPTRIIQLIEKFTFSYSTICKRQANAVEKIFSKYAIEIENIANDKDRTKEGKSDGIQQCFEGLKKRLKELNPSEDSFTASFMDYTYSNSQKGRMLTKYILQKLDGYYKKTDEQKIDFENVNVEHILPQKPAQEWGLSKEDIKEYVNKLGNLTLLDKKINSRVQNKIIKEKVEEYKKSTLPITIELVKNLAEKQLKWDKNIIEERQKEFASLAAKSIWNLS